MEFCRFTCLACGTSWLLRNMTDVDDLELEAHPMFCPSCGTPMTSCKPYTRPDVYDYIDIVNGEIVGWPHRFPRKRDMAQDSSAPAGAVIDNMSTAELASGLMKTVSQLKNRSIFDGE